MYVYIERNYFSFSNNNTNIFHNMIETSSEKNRIKIKPIIRSSISRIKRNNPSNVKVIKATNNRGRNYARQTVCFVLFRALVPHEGSLVARQTTADRRQVEKDDVPRARRLPIQDDCPILCIYTGVMLQPPSVQLIFVFVSRAKREFKTRNATRYLGEILPRIFQLPSAKQTDLKYARGTRPKIWTQVLCSEDSFTFYQKM